MNSRGGLRAHHHYHETHWAWVIYDKLRNNVQTMQREETNPNHGIKPMKVPSLHELYTLERDLGTLTLTDTDEAEILVPFSMEGCTAN